MKKKVLFMMIEMNIGGTERALLNRIAEMPKDKFDITILMLEKRGDLLPFIPDHVHVKVLHHYEHIKQYVHDPPKRVVQSLCKKGKYIKGLLFATVVLLSKLSRNPLVYYSYLLRKIPPLREEYGSAHAYAGPMDLISYFILHKVKAKEKIQWIHFDISKIGFTVDFAKKTYPRFSKITVVSEEAAEKVKRALPQLKEKIEVESNRVSQEMIRSLAKRGKGFEDAFQGIRVLTVGRLSKEKGQDLLIPVAAKLMKHFNIRCYCIGEGSARSEYEALIKKYGVENHFFLLGKKINPYPFMKECDLYVQPSRHEGFCLTLSEAKCFQKPIVATNFVGAKEQLKDEGLIVPITTEALYEGVKQVMEEHYLPIRKKVMR